MGAQVAQAQAINRLLGLGPPQLQAFLQHR